MQKVTLQLCIWWGCWGPSHQPATRRVALFLNAPLLVSLNISSLFVFTPCHSKMAKNKTHYLSSFYVFFPFASHFLFHFCFSQSTSNLFLRQAEPLWVLAGLRGFLPSLWLFQHPLPFGQGRKDVGSRAEAYSFVGCWSLMHCRTFGNKSVWLYSPGPSCFSYQCTKDISRKWSNPPEFLF